MRSNTRVVILQAMMQGLLDIYKLMKDKFRATPAHGHYVFTLHDISHVVEGMLLLSPRKTKSKPRRARAKKDNGNVLHRHQAMMLIHHLASPSVYAYALCPFILSLLSWCRYYV